MTGHDDHGDGPRAATARPRTTGDRPKANLPLRAAWTATIGMDVPPAVSRPPAGGGVPKVQLVPAFLGATVDFSNDRAPIYIQLATLFRRLIVTGQWPVGQKIPTHEQLALQLNVNPATIAKAVSLLAEEGLLKRSRRSGTSVIAKPAVTQTFRVGTTWRELLNNFETLEFELLTLRKDA